MLSYVTFFKKKNKKKNRFLKANTKTRQTQIKYVQEINNLLIMPVTLETLRLKTENWNFTDSGAKLSYIYSFFKEPEWTQTD